MAEGKWINELTATTPLVDAARHVLQVRLGVVRDRLPQAIQEGDRDPENVHQLRVATRRAGAALRIFGLCLPDKAYKRVRKRLRQLRRGAGGARDWDVFLAELSTRMAKAPERQGPGLDFLLGHGFAQRALAQEKLQQSCRKKRCDWDGLIRQTLAAVEMPSKAAEIRLFRDLAGPHLTGLVRELEESAARDLHTYEHLHRVRILGKRLRYAMEIFASCYGASFREEYYPAVEYMQNILGQANDSHGACQRLAGIRARLKATRPEAWERLRTGIEGLLRHHQRRLPQMRRRFMQWWNAWQTSGAESAFARLLPTQLESLVPNPDYGMGAGGGGDGMPPAGKGAGGGMTA